MAQWVQRTRADGTTFIQIKWRQDGRYHSESFSSVRSAVEFRSAVEAAGQRWPEGWVRGEGWVVPPPSSPSSAQVAGPPPSPVVPPPDPAAPEPPSVTFTDVATGEGGYFERQEGRVKRGKLTLYTVHRDRRVYDLHLVPTFGDLPFKAIDEHDVAAWIDRELGAGAAPKSVRTRHGLLSSIMKHGRLRLRLRADNPCELSELPGLDTARPEARQIRFFQQEEWALLRSCLAADIRLALDVDLATGLRWGELSALRIADMTFSGQGADRQASLHVVRAWSRRAPEDTSRVKTDEGESSTWVLGPPKSRRSRWVVVTGAVAQQLEAQVADRARADYVFVTSKGNPWRYPDFYTDRWLPARLLAERAGLDKKVTPHMLRHTAVVWSLAAGVPIQVISEMIGHTSLQMTYDVYGGLINLSDPAMGRAMADAMRVSAERGPTPLFGRDDAPPRRTRPRTRRVAS